jgi:tetratricopeptide (TPR) repeat protein
MAKKTVRFEPYFLENLEDERIPMAVAGYAALLKPGFVLDMTQVSESQDRSTRYVKIWDTTAGKDEGLKVSFRRTLDPKSGNPTSKAIEVAAFGMPEGHGASIRYETAWDKGNRSFMEMEAEGLDEQVAKIEQAFREEFAPPGDDDINKLKKQMDKALQGQQWGSTQDLAQAVLLWRTDDTDAILAIGSSAVISRNTDLAEKWMNRLLELQPDSYQARMNLGSVWMDRQDYDKAIEQYRAMLDLKPNEAFSPFILATAYEAKGETTGALEYYRKAAAMKKSPGPTDFPKLAKEAVERLSQR